MSGDAIRCYETAFDTMQKTKTVCVSETIYLLAWLWQSQTGRPNTEKNNGCFEKNNGCFEKNNGCFGGD